MPPRARRPEGGCRRPLLTRRALTQVSGEPILPAPAPARGDASQPAASLDAPIRDSDSDASVELDRSGRPASDRRGDESSDLKGTSSSAGTSLPGAASQRAPQQRTRASGLGLSSAAGRPTPRASRDRRRAPAAARRPRTTSTSARHVERDELRPQHLVRAAELEQPLEESLDRGVRDLHRGVEGDPQRAVAALLDDVLEPGRLLAGDLDRAHDVVARDAVREERAALDAVAAAAERLRPEPVVGRRARARRPTRAARGSGRAPLRSPARSPSGFPSPVNLPGPRPTATAPERRSRGARRVRRSRTTSYPRPGHRIWVRRAAIASARSAPVYRAGCDLRRRARPRGAPPRWSGRWRRARRRRRSAARSPSPPTTAFTADGDANATASTSPASSQAASGRIASGGAASVRYASTAATSAPAATRPSRSSGRPSAGRGRRTRGPRTRAASAAAIASPFDSAGTRSGSRTVAGEPLRGGGPDRGERERARAPPAPGRARASRSTVRSTAVALANTAQSKRARSRRAASSGAGSDGGANAMEGISRTSAPRSRSRAASASSPPLLRVTTTVRRSRRAHRGALRSAPLRRGEAGGLPLALAQDRAGALREQLLGERLAHLARVGERRAPLAADDPLPVERRDERAEDDRPRPRRGRGRRSGPGTRPRCGARNPRSASVRTRVSGCSSAASRFRVGGVVGARLERERALRDRRAASRRARGRGSRARRGRGGAGPAYASTTASSPSDALRSRVSTLPRTMWSSRSGRSALSCAPRRSEEVPTFAPFGSRSSVFQRGRAERVARVLALGHRADDEAGREQRRAGPSSSGRRSRRRAARSASSISFTNSPLPPTSASGTSRILSPRVTSSWRRTSRPGSLLRSREATWFACHLASGLRRVAMRIMCRSRPFVRSR